MADPNGALKGSEKIFLSGGLCEYLFRWFQLGSEEVRKDIPVRWSARISFWVVPMELSGGQKRYSSQVVCVNIFLAGINGALRGLRKDIPVRRSA